MKLFIRRYPPSKLNTSFIELWLGLFYVLFDRMEVHPNNKVMKGWRVVIFTRHRKYRFDIYFTNRKKNEKAGTKPLGHDEKS